VFNFGPAYANAEAHQIGLELLGSAGPLTLPATTYARIDRDLGLIRAAYPGLLNQTHSPAWVPNQLMVSVPNPQSPGYQCLNTYYQVTNIQPLFSTWYVLTFAGKVNVEALAGVYVASGEVTYAEPNGIIGGENFWHPADLGSGVWRWSIDDGFLDCFDGCDCHRYYVIDVNAAGQISLISYNEQGAAWCVFN